MSIVRDGVLKRGHSAASIKRAQDITSWSIAHAVLRGGGRYLV